MIRYFDKNKKEIKAGMTIKHIDEMWKRFILMEHMMILV